MERGLPEGGAVLGGDGEPPHQCGWQEAGA